jgi:HSP20 family protein
MTFNSKLIPWKWNKKNVPIRREESLADYSPFFALQQDMNRVFDGFFRSFGTGLSDQFLESSTDLFQPRIDLTETDKEICVSAELPGLDEKDLDLTVANDTLTIKGEKREEREENTNGYHRVERHYGAFHRVIPLPCPVERDKAEAIFKRGVLKVTLPKSEEAKQQSKKIPIKQVSSAT